jgi:diamine N-acetyltransferase
MNNENEVRLVRVDYSNLDDIIGLFPTEQQRHYVADNIYSLAEAYVVVMEGGHVFPFGIYAGDTPVGFVMIGYDYHDPDDDIEHPGFMKKSYLLWRLMIEKDQQNKGYGRKAVQLALDFMRAFPAGEAELCWVTYEPENEVARKLYASFGFEEQELPEGWDEVPALLRL